MSRPAQAASVSPSAVSLSASPSSSLSPLSSLPSPPPVSSVATSSPSSQWSSVSLAGLTLDSFIFDSLDVSGAAPHPEANPSGLRSDAEIAAYALPEQLNEVERLHTLLQSPHAIQRRSAASQLVRVLDGGPHSELNSDAVRELFVSVVRLLSELGADEQSEVSEAVAECADRGLISQQVCMEVLLPTLLHYLTQTDWSLTHTTVAASPSPSNGSSAPSPLSAASFTSSVSAATVSPRGPQLDPCINILRHLLTAHSLFSPLLSALEVFAEKSADSIHSSSRLVSAQLIGVLAPHMQPHSASKLLPSFLPLCQDTSLDVRAAMTCSVCRLAEAVRSSPASLQSIVSELSELLRDEELAVKQSALLSSVCVLPLLPASLQSSSLLPAFRSYLSSPPRLLHSTLARVLGEWCVSCTSSLLSDARVVRDFYRNSSVSGDNDVRYWCVYNMPALVSLLAPTTSSPAPLSPAALFDVAFLAPLLTSFSHDPHPPVRLSLSHSLPVVAPLLLRLSSQHIKLLKELVVTLLKDGEVDVRANILLCIPSLLSAHTVTSATPVSSSSSSPSHSSKFGSTMPSAPTSASGGVDAAVLTDVFRAMLAVDFNSLSYRHRMLYLNSLFSLRFHFTTHDMQYLYYDRLTPLLFASLHASPPLPLLQLLLAFLCHFLSSLPSSQRRHDLLLRLLRLYSPTSRSCYDRIVFVRLVDEMAASFSRRWMKKHVVQLALKLTHSESVREVKVRLVQVLGSRAALKCLDAKEREQFVKWVSSLTADGDRHTMERAQEFNARGAFEHGERGLTAEERALDEEDERRDREREEREDRLVRDEEELMEAMMRKEQVRERNVLLSSTGGSQTNNAVMLLMMKQKKEREKVATKEMKEKEREASAAAASSTFTQLAPVTPQHSKAGVGVRVQAGSVSRTGRVRGASDRGPANTAGEEKERDSGSKRDDRGRDRDRDEDDRKERGRPRGYLPGLSSAASTPSSSSSSASTPLSSVALRSSSPSSSPPSSLGKRSVPLLPSASMHPMSRRFPPTPTATASTATAGFSLSVSHSALPSSFIPALNPNSSPRLVKLSHTAAAATSKPVKLGNSNHSATLAAGGSSTSSSRRI